LTCHPNTLGYAAPLQPLVRRRQGCAAARNWAQLPLSLFHDKMKVDPAGELKMIRIVATEEQAKKIAEARESVEVVDPQGNRLGYLARSFSDEDLRIARERLSSNEERRSTQMVVERLKSMEGS
jgi:hypothetical protein